MKINEKNEVLKLHIFKDIYIRSILISLVLVFLSVVLVLISYSLKNFFILFPVLYFPIIELILIVILISSYFHAHIVIIYTNKVEIIYRNKKRIVLNNVCGIQYSFYGSTIGESLFKRKLSITYIDEFNDMKVLDIAFHMRTYKNKILKWYDNNKKSENCLILRIINIICRLFIQ